MDERTPNSLGWFYFDEAARGVKVILAALVNNADIALRFRIFVWKNAIDLMQLQ